MSSQQLPLTTNSDAQSLQWLSLKEASDILGVHYATLRSWADKGEIRAFRTPGGHRRFRMADLKTFLESRVSQPIPVDEGVLVEAAVGRVRQEMEKSPHHQAPWRANVDAETRDSQRMRGRQLFSLAITFVLKPNQRVQILESGKALGREYGMDAAQSQVSLAETGRAVQFFRGQLIHAIRHEENPELRDAEDVRIQRLIDQFLDEVLYSVLEGYEQAMGGDEDSAVQVIEIDPQPTAPKSK